MISSINQENHKKYKWQNLNSKKKLMQFHFNFSALLQFPGKKCAFKRKLCGKTCGERAAMSLVIQSKNSEVLPASLIGFPDLIPAEFFTFKKLPHYLQQFMLNSLPTEALPILKSLPFLIV